MFERGTMRPLKKIIGAFLLVAGAGLIFTPDTITPILCDNKMSFAFILLISGYFHIISGRRI